MKPKRDKIKEIILYLANLKALKQHIQESKADIKAGRCYTHKAVAAEMQNLLNLQPLSKPRI